MAHDLLTTIQRYLSDEGLDCALLYEEGEEEDPKLLVYLGRDSKSRERVIEITADEQVMPAHFPDLLHMQVERGCYRLQIQSLIPLEFLPRHGAQMASAVNFLNGMLELPGLISDEVHNKVLYKTVQMLPAQDCHKTLLIGIVGMHRMVLDLFAPLLEAIGTGQTTYLELLDQIVQHTSADAN